MKRIPIGLKDYKKLKDENYYVVDKSLMIKEYMDRGSEVTLITRPRRFGKTINMSMLAEFFDITKDSREIFKDTAVMHTSTADEINRYPTIFLTFADAKGSKENIIYQIKSQLMTAYDTYAHVYEELRTFERVKLERISTGLMEEENVSLDKLTNAISFLMLKCHQYYGKKVMLFIDEYDTPFIEAHALGFYDELRGGLASMLHTSLKTSNDLQYAMLTGIQRVAKENIFSDLNNPLVCTVKDREYAEYFGFTKQEVKELLEAYGFVYDDAVRQMYDCNNMGGIDIYNPWSITKYLDTGKFDSYWVNTSSNSLIDKLIQGGTSDIKIAMEDLLEGKTIETAIDEEIIFEQLENNSAAVWSLLLACGYLKVNKASKDGAGGNYILSLTNFEVQNMFRRMIQGWFGNVSVRYNDFIKALLSDDLDYMNQYMNQVAMQTFSFFDTGKKAEEQEEPERFYHGFVLGLMVDLADKYRITSNRESGLGRYDIMMEPLEKNKRAYVIEFKVHKAKREKDLEETAQNALQQIAERNYDAELMARGIRKENIRHLGFAFWGKKVLIEQE